MKSFGMKRIIRTITATSLEAVVIVSFVIHFDGLNTSRVEPFELPKRDRALL